jgi:RNA polymerase sigma-70 factor (ECF subfamily)
MNDDEGSDDAVLARLHAQPELVGVLYARHAPAVFRFLARRTGVAAAEDLLSEVFVAALGGRRHLAAHPSRSALPWLYGIAANVVRHHLRRTAPPGHAVADAGVDWDAVADRLDAQAQRSQLVAALSALTPVERDLLLLVAWEELTPAQAAEALGISKVAARSRLHRARLRAAQALTQAPPPAAAVRPTR